jgi:gamma-glutamyltranspeptidase/glutathione hydrolase
MKIEKIFRVAAALLGGLFFLISGPARLYAAEDTAPAVFKLSGQVVASAHPEATRAGLSVLKEGGNAVDAAVAVQMVLNVVEPQSSGIGGGCFILFYQASAREVIVIDGREEAPRSAFSEMFLDPEGKEVPFYPERITGGNSVGVPGCLAALHKAWKRFGSGKVSWGRLFDEAVRLAEDGFPVSAKLAGAVEGERARLTLFPASASVFLDAEGRALKEGSLLIQKDLAATFRLIQGAGPEAFYQGEIARDIVRAVREAPVNPGLMALEDLQEYAAPFRRPLRGTYRGYEVFSMPPPSSGGVTLLEALNIMEPFAIGAMNPSGAEFVHVFSEAQKMAFADRNYYLGDPDYADVPVDQLLSKELASAKSAAIDLRKVTAGVADPSVLIGLGNNSTSHVSVIDTDGNFLAMTTTIEHIFGAALTVPGRGFILNNELTDFSARPFLDAAKKVPSPNQVEGGRKKRATSLDAQESYGGKRPLSSMSPTLIFREGRPIAALGSPGGTQIIGIVLNVIVRLIDFGRSPEEAMAAPRILNRNGPLELEKDFFADPILVGALRAMGHDLILREPFGNAQLAILTESGARVRGAADPRGEGRAGEA